MYLVGCNADNVQPVQKTAVEISQPVQEKKFHGSLVNMQTEPLSKEPRSAAENRVSSAYELDKIGLIRLYAIPFKANSSGIMNAVRIHPSENGI